MKKIYTNIRAERGMTLIEMVISLTIFSIISTGMLSMMIFTTNAYQEHQAMINDQSELRLIMDFLADTLSVAQDITLSDEPVGDSYYAWVEEDDNHRPRFTLNANGQLSYPYHMRAENLEISCVLLNERIVRVTISSKRYELVQDIYCRNTIPKIMSGTSFACINFILPEAS